MATCCFSPSCKRPTVGRGLCANHYQQARYHGLNETVPHIRDACVICGATLPDSIRFNAMYCSTRCKDRAVYARRIAGRIRQFPTCLQCGADLANHRIDAKYCCDKCGQDHHNAEAAARRLASKADRLPCKFCGGPIPAADFVNKRFCSKRCQIRGRRAETYGLTQAELDALLAQHGVCAICQSTAWGKKGPQVDHDHATGAVRAVLCINCNRGLGLFKDDPTRLRAAADYLDLHI